NLLLVLAFLVASILVQLFQALLPLVLKSSSPRIVNVSSKLGQLKNVEDESIKRFLSDFDELTEELVDKVVNEYLKDAKHLELLEKKGWSSNLSGYIVSKAALNAYTRILAKKYPSVCVNAITPGLVATDMTFFKGPLTAEEGAKEAVRLALIPDGGPSGRVYPMKSYKMSSKILNTLSKRELMRLSNGFVITDFTSNTGELTSEEGAKSPVMVALLPDDGPSGNEVYDENAHLLTAIIEQPHHLGEECIKTNYYGTKRVTESFLPLLELSKSPRIVNVSSNYGELQCLHNVKLKKELQDIEHLTEERIDGIIQWFLRDLKANKLLENGWPLTVSAYKVSKIAVNAYTRLSARKYQNILVNCVHPGYVITDITSNTGELTSEEGANAPVMVALLPDDGPSGVYFKQMQISSF
nr:hypothetical protein [Tanacetum cinerariifolium]